MNDACLTLTIYFGERDRARGKFLADALVDIYERHAFQASVMLRGIEGFGIKHHLHTARLLTLSENLPLVSVAVDTRSRVEAALPEISAIGGHGLITLERARMLTGHVAPDTLARDCGEATKLTVYCGRRERVDDRSAYLALVERLHGAGVAGATVLLGVDGTARGVRHRARFFGRNVNVPLMIVAVGDGDSVRSVIGDLAAVLRQPLMTLERARIVKRDGQRLAAPHDPPRTDASGLSIWQKLTIFASEQTRHDGAPLYPQLIQRLRQAGAAGATSLPGI